MTINYSLSDQVSQKGWIENERNQKKRIVGRNHDDRFLVKPTKSVLTMIPNADMEVPYEGAKEMILVDDVENREFLRELLEAMYKELPAPKKKK